MRSVALLIASYLAVFSWAQVTFQDASNTMLRVDNGTQGPPIEEVHFPPTGSVQNLPANALNTSWNGIDFGSGNSSALINVQALEITPALPQRPETLWLLDTGRPTIHDANNNPSMPYAQPGGPKIVAVNITSNDGGGANGSHNDTVYAVYTFPSTVHYPDSYMNDLRFDLHSDVSGTSGHGICYIVDSSNEGRPGFIMLDLGTGESWRRLNQDPSVLRGPWNIPSYVGNPFYLRQKGMPLTGQLEGLDGIQLSPDGSRMYYSPLSTADLWSIPTVNLRARDSDELAELAAHGNVSSHGQRGGDANGFEGDDQGRIYQCMPTQNAIYYYDPGDLQTHGFVRDPRIVWPDGASVGEDGYIYMNINQLYFQGDWNNGVDTRTHPGAILRAKLPNGASKQRIG
ncbi:MAG: hypothetical protein Q9159_003722 [Coniocarpon cinnabarinum]